MNQNRPRGRDKNVTSGGSGAHRRGEGLGTGRVGSGSFSGGSSSGGNGIKRAAAGGGGGLAIIIMIVAFILKGGGGNSGGSTPSDFSSSDTSSNSYISDTNVDTSVAGGSRAKRTVIKGNNKDTVTIMVYMCGTDLESKYGMASADMEEMRAASFGDNVNLIVYTGGCKSWKNSGISSSVNQVYQIKNGKINRLVDDDGSKAMTDPNNLANFIKYCSKNFPANRNELILWDHG